MIRSFLPRLDKIKSKTNQCSEDQRYITEKQNEFSKIYDISEAKVNQYQNYEPPEYITVSPTKKRRNDDDDDEIPDLDENDEEETNVDENDPDYEYDEDEEEEANVDEDDPDYEYVEEEEDDEEFEKPKSKRRCTMSFPRVTAAAIRFGISSRALCILIWALLMGKKSKINYGEETSQIYLNEYFKKIFFYEHNSLLN